MTGRRRGQQLALCWGSVEEATLFGLAEAASVAGIGAIAVTPRHYVAQVEAGISDAEMRRRLADLGVAVTIIDPLIAPMPGIPALRDIPEAMRWLFKSGCEESWRAAEALEVDVINLTHFLGGAVTEAEMADAMAKLAQANRAHGVATTIEFIPGTGVPDLITAARLVRDVPDLRIMFDCWHFARSSGALTDIEALPLESIGGAQINDWMPAEPGAPYVAMAGRLLPGDGCLPLADIMARIELNSPGLDVGIEIFNAHMRVMGTAAAVGLMAARTMPVLASGGATE